MREGLEADDGWRLVEDEFEMTARLFTRHLHHGELQRQKQLAKTRNQNALDAITGQINGKADPAVAERPPPDQTQAVPRSKDTVASNLDVSNRQGDDPWLSDPRLAGLMSNKHTKAPLAKIGALQSTSRAAHGYSKGQASPPKRRRYAALVAQDDQILEVAALSPKQEDSDGDDLDGPSIRKEIKFSHVKTKTDGARLAEQKPKPKANMKRETMCARQASNPISSKASRISHVAPVADSSDDDDDFFGMFAPRRAQGSENKATGRSSVLIKKEKEDDNETRKRPVKEDEIPTFLV